MAVSPYHLTSNGPRVNTIVVDLATIPTRKITMDLIVRFINHNLKIQFSTVQSLQHNTGKSLVFLECQSEDQALAAADKNDGKHEITIENIKYAVNVYMEDGATTVRIHDISPQFGNRASAGAVRGHHMAEGGNLDRARHFEGNQEWSSIGSYPVAFCHTVLHQRSG